MDFMRKSIKLGVTLLVVFFLSLNVFGQNTAAEYIDLGIEKFETKEYMEAIVAFNEAITLDETSYQAYFMRGNIKQKFADVHGAMKDYNNAIDTKDDFTEAYFERGNLKYLLQDYYGAINDYTMTIAPN
ncbi:MAG: tetratricopeptide (TPR) repeat protein, partial [Marivirga sp.]